MTTLEFQPWPKIARLNRNIVITEKIDGTNGAIVIVKVAFGQGTFPDYDRVAIITADDPELLGDDGLPDFEYHVYVQSRNRFITEVKGKDNAGFAAWVKRNAEALVATLGPGTHFGEWWGSGIQRKYGLIGGDKRFSLFNTARWSDELQETGAIERAGIPGLGVVPVLYDGPFDQYAIEEAIARLEIDGSVAAPGFDTPEGIVIYHEAARSSFKVTIANDAAPFKAEQRNPLDLLPPITEAEDIAQAEFENAA